MDLELKDRVAIVTGGGMGIGKDVARFLAEEGCDVVICARTMSVLEATAAEISEATGRRVLPLFCDTNSDDAVNAMVEKTIEAFGRVDILVNGAAAPSGVVRNSIEFAGADELLGDMNTKVIGYFRCAKAVTPHMKKAGFGRIINITSPISKFGMPGQGNYAASKAGQVAFGASLAKETARRKITVNCVSPGFIATDLISDLSAERVEMYLNLVPMRRFGEVEEVAQAVLFLASREASYITGTVLEVTGGL